MFTPRLEILPACATQTLGRTEAYSQTVRTLRGDCSGPKAGAPKLRRF